MPTLITIPKEHRALLSRLTPEDVERLRLSRANTMAPGPVGDTSQVTGPGAVPAEPTKPKRKHVDRSSQWPAVGTFLEGQFRGETFRAQVVAAPKLKSKRALKLLSAPVKGIIATSYSKAQDIVTLAHRQKLGVRGKIGLPAAWIWWKAATSP
ncbi:MAG TPA: hypothetical protein VGP44_12440 [Gemmatimonadales bacterium]|nr:hypothetical protein [Chloroflexota bacterium]HEV8178479.1 hypothetical protein [Gemmatimonadales bacterium]